MNQTLFTVMLDSDVCALPCRCYLKDSYPTDRVVHLIQLIDVASQT